MKHMKRHAVPKNWPVPRKGTTFVVSPNFGDEKGMPILVILRDVLKIAKTRKEVKKALFSKNILINGKPVKDEKNPAMLLDSITIIPSKKSYRIELTSNGKFTLSEIKENESESKTAKIIGKKILKGKKVQINLNDGKNFLYDKTCKVGDSVLVDLKNKKIQKCLPLKEKSNVLVFAGKHAGTKGELEKIDKKTKIASINKEDGKVNVLIKQLMAVE